MHNLKKTWIIATIAILVVVVLAMVFYFYWQKRISYLADKPGGASIEISKTVSDDDETDATETSSSPGEVLTYKINYQNTGDVDLRGVWITDILPVNTTYISCSNGCGLAGEKVGFILGDLAVGQAEQVNLQIKVNDSLDYGVHEIYNSATIGAWVNDNELPTQESNQVKSIVIVEEPPTPEPPTPEPPTPEPPAPKPPGPGPITPPTEEPPQPGPTDEPQPTEEGPIVIVPGQTTPPSTTPPAGSTPKPAPSVAKSPTPQQKSKVTKLFLPIAPESQPDQGQTEVGGFSLAPKSMWWVYILIPVFLTLGFFLYWWFVIKRRNKEDENQDQEQDQNQDQEQGQEQNQDQDKSNDNQDDFSPPSSDNQLT